MKSKLEVKVKSLLNSICRGEKIIFLFFILLPLIFWPWSHVPYEVPKVFLFYIFTVVLLFFAARKIILRKLQYTGSKLILGLISIFILIQFSSSLVNGVFHESWLGNTFRWDGLITLVFFGLYTISISIVWDKSYRKSLIAGIAWGAILASIWAVAIGVGRNFGIWESVLWEGAVGTGFGNPNLLAGYLLVSLPVVWRYAKSLNLSFLAKSGLQLGVIAALLLTQSFIGLFGAGLWIILEISLLMKGWKRLVGFLAALICGSIVLYSMWSWTYPGEIFVAESRIRIFNKLTQAAQKKPLLGYGWAQVSTAFDEGEWPIGIEVRFDIVNDKAHSTLLEVMVSSGIVGLTIYLVLIAAVAFVIWNRMHSSKLSPKDKNWYNLLFVILLIFLWHSQLNVISVSEELIFWTIVGVIGSQNSL